jgi:hypothetical protein
MAQVGDRVEVMSRKGGPRRGVVTLVSGVMITVRWESGEESSLVPGPGALQVVSGGAKAAAKKSAKKSGDTSPEAKKPSKKGAKGAKKTR